MGAAPAPPPQHTRTAKPRDELAPYRPNAEAAAYAAVIMITRALLGIASGSAR
jgi:hypothetical protein